MELIQAHQISFEELLSENIDIIIAACGYESRSTHLAQLSHFNARKKIALLFKENADTGSRKDNEEVFKNNNFECIELSASSTYDIEKVLQKICESGICDSVKLLVDYSSMTRTWYGTMINYFIFNELSISNLVVYFAYTPEHFIPKAAKKTEYKKPTPVFFNRTIINSNKPVTLLVGLGDDDKKVDFLCDFFKPQNIFFYLPSPSFDEKSTDLIYKKNKDILSRISSKNVISYSATNIDEIEAKLKSLTLNERIKNRIILVSLGPKTFSLASFLLNARYPDVEIWQMSDTENVLDLKPAGIPIVYKAILVNDEE